MTRLLYALAGTDKARPFSPHVWKIAMALAHKGLDYETVPVGFTEIPRIENGCTATVPLLRDGERLVADSFAIALHLDEAYPDRPSLFGGEGGRAMARFIENWSQSTLHPAITRIAILDIHGMLGAEDQAYFRRSREQRLAEGLVGHVGHLGSFPLLVSLWYTRRVPGVNSGECDLHHIGTASGGPGT